jgi:homoserine kinase type II
MTLDTAVDRTELTDIAEDYGLGTITAVSPIPLGPVNGSYCLETPRGRHLLRVEKEKGELDVKRELDLLVYLRKHGLPCPQPLTDRKGRLYRESGGQCVSLYRWLDPHAKRPDRLTATRLETVGRALAELHVVGKSYKKGVENRFSFERVAELYGGLRDRLPHYYRKVVRTLDDEIAYLEHYLEQKLPKGIIHGDVRMEHLLFRGDKLVAILEFESACRGKFIFDLATAVNALCADVEGYDLKRFESLIAGYESVRPLSLAEWDAFPNELRLSALRFTIARLGDALLRTDDGGRADKDFRGFYERLRILRREREGGMEALLMAMATGYDYRKYQRIKALEKKGSSR